ncbi:MAG: family 10 glycosylhydrolase [Verrucomicrobia bacterium]|nr:family 10 glycosylhydrolase [Verrucomicrobiota bacterium]
MRQSNRIKICRAGLAGSRHIPRIIYNDDSCTLRNSPPPHTSETMACALDYLKGTQVDCLCWCVGAQIAYSWPSKVIENFYDLVAERETSFGGLHLRGNVMCSLHRQGIDYLPLLIRRAHAQGLMFVASFRMNDTHHKSYPNSVLSPEFWKTHQHYRIWDATDAKSYYNAALDYSYPEVRNRYRSAIVEVASEYDVDGIELDFTRSPYFFQPSEAWRKRTILTRFVREVRDALKRITATTAKAGQAAGQVGTRRKRSLILILRIPSLERALTTAGIDARRWIMDQLAPILVISELVGNFNQDIGPWRTLCRQAGVLLYPAAGDGPPAYNMADFYSPLVRNLLAPRHDGQVRFTDDEQMRYKRAAAQNLLAQEPDGIYLFNFPCWLAEGKNIMHTDPAKFRRVTSLLREMGSLKTLARKNKKFTFYKDLPIYVEANRPRRFHQTIPFAIRGKDIRDAMVTLRFRWIAERNPHADEKFRQHSIVKSGLVKVYLNDREIPERKLKKTRAPVGRIPSGFLLKAHEIVELQAPGRELRDGENTLAFEMPKFPHERDPYVYIYEFEVELNF